MNVRKSKREGKKASRNENEKPLMIKFNNRRNDIVSHLKVTFVGVVKIVVIFRDAIVYFFILVKIIVS